LHKKILPLRQKKRRMRRIYLVAFWLVCVGFSSCATAGKDKKLVGKWRLVFDREACLQNMPEKQRKAFDAQPKAQQEAILKEIAEQVERDNWIEFRADQSFEQVLLEGETKHIGKWEIKGGGTQVLLKWLKNPNDKTPQRETCNIIRLEKNTLVLETNHAKTRRLSFVPHTAAKNKKESSKPIQKAQAKS
jgi:hypothetical protein